MKFVALISGGKDSCYNIFHCLSCGHELVALANIQPSIPGELDSYMYQTVGHEAIHLLAQAFGCPLYQNITKGKTLNNDLYYSPNEDNLNTCEEVEDLFNLLTCVKQAHPHVKGVSSGAILSDYQRLRIENVCFRLNLVSLCYLWRRDQEQLIREMIDYHLDAIIIKVASLGLSPEKHLSSSLSSIYKEIIYIGEKFTLNVCGEGGEYESLVLDCPLFDKKLVIDNSEVIKLSNDPFSPSAYLSIKQIHLETKLKKIASNKINNLTIPPLFNLPLLPTISGSILQLCESFTLITQESDRVNNCTTSEPIFQSGNIHYTTQKLIEEYIVGYSYSWIRAVANYDGTNNIELSVTRLMDSIGVSLLDNNLDWSNVIHCNLFLRNMNDYTKINSIYMDRFPLMPPSRVCIELLLPLYNICSIELILLNNLTPIDSGSIRCMHVQSISYWAPANIGPYSQCYSVYGILHTAGQIGLIPSSMTLAESELQPQLSLQHCQSVLLANYSDLSCTVLATCYAKSRISLQQSKAVMENIYNNGEYIPYVTYLIIPNLPRNAQVEWHITAFSTDLFSIYNSYNTEVNSFYTVSRITIFFCPKSSNSVFFTIHICMKDYYNCILPYDVFVNDISQSLTYIYQILNSNFVTIAHNHLYCLKLWSPIENSDKIFPQLLTMRTNWSKIFGLHFLGLSLYNILGILNNNMCIFAIQGFILS